MDWPGWNSLTAVTRYHNLAEVVGIVILALLVAAELIAHKYSGRKDFLTGQQATAAAQKETAATQKHDEEMARLQGETAAAMAQAEKYKADIAEANVVAAKANERANQATLELAKLQTPRTLTMQQQQKIVDLLKDSPKGPVSVANASFDSTDATSFSTSIKDALTKAGFTIVDPPDALKSVLIWDRPGAWLLVHSLRPTTPAYARSIQNAFGAIGIFLEGLERPKDVPEGTLVIAVSSHPLKPEPIPPGLLGVSPK